MKKSYQPNLYLALMHYPVVNKKGDVIASAVTNLDLHDIARAAKTYGVPTFYVVTPLKDQKELIEKILDHWRTGIGAKSNPYRREALDLIMVKNSLKEVLDHIRLNGPGEIQTIATSASKTKARNIGYDALRESLNSGNPHLLLFGTAWGFSTEFIAGVDHVLEPIRGNSEYNHISVRSAASIILDRLIGNN